MAEAESSRRPKYTSDASSFYSSPLLHADQNPFASRPPSGSSLPSPMASYHDLDETPYSHTSLSRQSVQTHSVSEKFSLPADPSAWGSDLLMDHPEPDDALHNPPNPKWAAKTDHNIMTARGVSNLGCLVIIVVALLALFLGYPLQAFFTKRAQSTNGGFNAGGINASGQVPSIPNNFGMIDVDTPQSAYAYQSFADGSEWQLVFSDEFEQDGRTFWPGDDPYWEAVDLWYWQTGDLEWYTPEAVTTNNGSLELTISAKEKNGLSYISASLSTWNKFCFTGGLIMASVSLPGSSSVAGLWPAIWTMGNLGRVGYGASTDGLWPYNYDACDIGTIANQSRNGAPAAALAHGDPYNDNKLSFLPGQRLSRCTCPGEPHPGPVHAGDGTFVGRSAPEIDIFEAKVNGGPNSAGLSQSVQYAPMNAEYKWKNVTGNFKLQGAQSELNSYTGGAYQQAVSGVTPTNPDCFTQNTGCFSTHGFEYKPGYANDSAYITWIADGSPAWTLDAEGMSADPLTEINDRPIPQEPMYIIANLAMSAQFSPPDFDNLVFPATMRIDWIRVYQPKDAINTGCDPADYPTSAYINQFAEAYNNPNLTMWTTGGGGYNQTMPKNSFLGQC